MRDGPSRRALLQRARTTPFRCGQEGDGTQLHKENWKRGSRNNGGRRKVRRIAVRICFRLVSPRHPRKNAPLRQPRRPGAHRGPSVSECEGDSLARLAIVGKREVTRFAAVGAIIQAVSTQAHIVLAFADGAILLATAIFLGLVALHANNLLVSCCHGRLRKELYLRERWAASGAWGEFYWVARAAGKRWIKTSTIVGAERI